MEISSSPERFSFQKERYIVHCKESNVEPSQEHLEMFEEDKKRHDHKFDDPESRIDNMEYDLLTTSWILEKVRSNKIYAQNLYAALCNNEFTKNEIWPRLKEEKWSCSWRYAGGIIADMRQEGDYIDWYCSGIVRGGSQITEDGESVPGDPDIVGEAVVTDEIRNDLLKLGWIVATDDTMHK